ncbi:G2/mitotic-specific cyclin-B3-like [Oscarella lobularis]|uniref:G2/mitotic-specific cyclin-B3-like n=1 Tax=Oscarella lobularis TaxID=121494 RepID=UPI0033142CDF
MGIQKTIDETFQQRKTTMTSQEPKGKKSTKRAVSSPSKAAAAAKRPKRAALENLTNAGGEQMASAPQASKKSVLRSHTRRSSSLPLQGIDEVKEETLPVPVPLPYKDIDDTDDPLFSPEYAQDIFIHMKGTEDANQIRRYMDRQPLISIKLRTIVIDWMVEVQESFELYHETLYLSVKYVDRYLEKEVVPREQLQLVAMAAMLIASKFEEMQPPLVDDFIYICDDAYTREELLSAERKMLKVLSYDLNTPIAYRFLRRFAQAAEANLELHTLARYICELTLQEYDFIEHKASLLAASALYLAQKMKNAGSWCPTLEHYSGYVEKDLMPCVHQLNALVGQTPKENVSVVRKKYSHQVFYRSSTLPAYKF